MTKSLLTVAVAAVLLAVTVSTARSAFITEQVTLEVRDPNGQAPFPAPVDPLLNIRRLDTSGGNVFTNQFSSPAGPFGVGGEIHTITASLLTMLVDGASFTPLVDNRPATLGNDLVGIFAVQGSITAGAPIAEALFTLGRGYIVSVAPGTFDPRNPSTWGWAAGTFVEMMLAPPDAVVPGAGEPISFSASVMNTSSANTTASAQADGRFLFLEDSTAVQNADPKGGDNWFTVTTNSSGGFPQINEGFVSQTFQTIEFADINAVGVPTAGGPLLSGAALDAVDLAVMNAIFADMLLKEGAAAGVFATGFGAALVTDFNPRWPPPAGDGPTGDFRGELQTRNAFGAEVAVPEPSSMVIFGLGLSMVGLYRGVQRRRLGE